MAALLPNLPFTLLVQEGGAELWNPDGALVASLPAPSGEASTRSVWAPLLQEHLPPKSPVQILVQTPTLTVLCQDVPPLNPRERREAAERLMAVEEPGGEALDLGSCLDADPHADGGHQLWVAGHPAREMRAWLGALASVQASLVFAGPWQRALLAGLGPSQAKDRLVLQLAVGGGNLLYLRGRALVLQRTFRMPADLDPLALDEGTAEVLQEILVEELSRTLQFLKQKHRGVAFEQLDLLGLAELPAALEDRLARGLRLRVGRSEADVRALLTRGAAVERAAKDGLTLVPLEVLEAARLRLLRLGVWAAAAVVLVLCGAGWFLLASQERLLAQDVAQAEQGLLRYRDLIQERDKVAGRRFPLLRLRAAEARQVDATQELGRLADALMTVPEGIRLERVEVFQQAGEALSHRFSITGLARTRRDFSVGPLARYVAALSARPGVQLQPLQEVAVLDGRQEGASAPEERALTRFTLEGSASAKAGSP